MTLPIPDGEVVATVHLAAVFPTHSVGVDCYINPRVPCTVNISLISLAGFPRFSNKLSFLKEIKYY